jgi:branched-chain amino acid transport system ATP-binding protein
MSLLEIEDLSVAYGAIEAVKGISLKVEQGQVVTLLGTNGAGKTTTLRAISGLLRPRAGEVRFDGKVLNGEAAHDVVKAGLAHSPEGRRIFPLMTVEENLELGAYSRGSASDVRKDIAAGYERFPRLEERRAQKAGTLSGGEQQMLAIARALMSRPRLLMLDEPSMGLSPIMMQLIFSTIRELKESGTTILLVEQNAQAALGLADHGYVLETGRIVLEGTGKDLMNDDSVRKAYLGED